MQRKPAHHLQSTRRALRRDGQPPQLRGLDGPAPGDVADAQLVAGTSWGDERPSGFVVDPPCRHLDGLPFRVAQRRQPPAEHASCVQAQRVVDPVESRCGGVSVDHHRPAAVVLGPRVAHRQPVLVALAGGVAVQRKGPHPARRPPVVGLLQASVGNDESSVIQHEVGDQVIAPVAHLPAELGGLCLQLRERGLQAMSHLDVLAVEGADQLGLVIAGHRDGVTRRSHAHRQPQHTQR